jgi:membrane protein required for colicin V production
MPFTLLDGILLVVILISAVLAMIRGFTREVFSIASWVAAAAVAYFFWGDLLPFVQRYVNDRNLALGITVAGIFFVTLLLVSIITMRISDFVLDSRAGPVDRVLGFAFGAARGLILVIIAVLFINFFIAPDKQPEWIAMAKSKPWLDTLGQDLMNRLPEDPEAEIMQKLRGDKGQASAPATGDDVVQEPGSEGDDTSPAPDEPGIAPDDQNQLDRELDSPPPD